MQRVGKLCLQGDKAGSRIGGVPHKHSTAYFRLCRSAIARDSSKTEKTIPKFRRRTPAGDRFKAGDSEKNMLLVLSDFRPYIRPRKVRRIMGELRNALRKYHAML